MATVQAKMQSIIDKANATTGKQDKDLTAATQSLVDGFGQGENLFELASSWNGAFSENKSLINVPGKDYYFKNTNPNFSNISRFMDNNRAINGKVTFDIVPSGTIAMNSAFFWCGGVREIDFLNRTIKPYIFHSAFQFCEKLVKINAVLDFSYLPSALSCFLRTESLEYIRIAPDTLAFDLSFQDSAKLSPESIQSIIDGLAQVAESKTIKFHPTVKAKLTEAQITQITSKNWTLA